MTHTASPAAPHLPRDSAGAVTVCNAQLIDGTGQAAYPADVVVEGGMIVAIAAPGSLREAEDRLRIDADGAVVCPGFIDVHSHADNAALLEEDDLTKIAQGVTTEVTGNCGYSLAPVDPHSENSFVSASEKLFRFTYSGWHSINDWFALIDSRKSVTNSCPLIGHGALRLATIGAADRAATLDDATAMGRLLEEAVAAGAFGLSTGLIYPPGMYSNTEELIRVASHLPEDRVYATHMRDESSRLLESIDEAIAIGREAGCRVQISHVKAAGKQNWGGVQRALDALDAARAGGLSLTQDVYPYAAAATALSVCLPPWAHDGGAERTLRLLRDRAAVHTIREQIEAGDDGSWENILFGAGSDGVMVSDTRSHRNEGKTLADIAQERDIDAIDALISVLIEEDLDARMIIFDMDERDIEAALRSPHTSIGSDGLPPGRAGRQHPRLYGTFPRFLGQYVRERGILELPEAIRRITSLPAQTFGVPQRGTVAVGQVADLVCFDPATIDHPGTFQQPDLDPVGINWVVQSGHTVMNGGRWAGVRRGSRLTPA